MILKKDAPLTRKFLLRGIAIMALSSGFNHYPIVI
jgi:hypothetical protein